MTRKHKGHLLRLHFAQIALWVGLGVGVLFSSGCHSAFVEATVVNHSGAEVRLLELDYPSASFGTGELAAGATFRYRFKVLGSGAAKLSWTDAQEKEHSSFGTMLQEGDEGKLIVTLGPQATTWSPELHSTR